MLELAPVGRENLWALVRLSVAEPQRAFVATNAESILEAYATRADGGAALPFGIYADGEPVGFVMLGYGVCDADDPEIARGNYCLWRFMIDAARQRRGYGRQALQAVLDYLATRPLGPAEGCWLSYEPENIAARELYRSFGFVETGEICGGETVAYRKI